MMQIRRRFHAVVNSDWFIPVWCVACASATIASSVWMGATGPARDVQMFLSGGFLAFTALDVMMRRRIRRYERRSIEYLLSPEQQDRMQRQMVEAGERALAEMRGRNPDVHIEGGLVSDEDPGVRH